MISENKNIKLYKKTGFGKIYLADSLNYLSMIEDKTVDLIVTSPPFGLVRKKEYGNVEAEKYIDWFKPFGKLFHRVLKSNGSLVIDIGGSWTPGKATRSLYHFKLLIMLCEEFGFHLAQDFYWWNPSKLPTPAEWVTVRRIRVKDAINCIWWLSPSPWPKASNKRVLQPYSKSMVDLLKRGYKTKKRPSGHDISNKFSINNKAAIPPNLIATANTDSNSYYLRYCKEKDLKPHPARFPSEIPEFFIRMLTEEGDLVVDPFAGSCVTGEVCERLRRNWVCIELIEEYLVGARGRFDINNSKKKARNNVNNKNSNVPSNYYRIPRPDLLWNGDPQESLLKDGGAKRLKNEKLKSIKTNDQSCNTSKKAIKNQLTLWDNNS